MVSLLRSGPFPLVERMRVKLKIVQAGDPVLRQAARPFSVEEIVSAETQRLIELMRETMRDAPGVGLAAPQIDESVRLVVIEDRPEYAKDVPPDRLAERGRVPVSFHVLANPTLTMLEEGTALFFEGCLSLTGFVALTPRALAVRVDALDERGEPVSITARGWYARILQHEIDHLNGTLYVDRMLPRSFMNQAAFARHWQDASVAAVCSDLGIVLDE
jgi:peptide deformylase